MPQYRTDLAIESAMLPGDQPIDGIVSEEYQREGYTVSRIEVVTPGAGERIGKPPGRYITLQASGSLGGASRDLEAGCDLLVGELSPLLPAEGLILVVGLGNDHITPDALGPAVIDLILATRHIGREMAEECGLSGLRPVAALAPGVLGQTGIETAEIIHSLVRSIQPAGVIAIDALAARDAARLGSTVQLADSGIAPGAGVMNHRRELSRASLGVPVISVGIPTVVDASTLAYDLLEGDDPASIKKIAPRGASMMVTPRDIDLLISRGANLVAMAVNRALQPGFSAEELSYLVT